MKKLFFLLLVSTICVSGAFSQDLSMTQLSSDNKNLIVKEGKFYTDNNTLFSGACITYYESGAKKSNFNVKDGNMEGEAFYYFENGNIMEKGFYANNEKTGEWIRWDEAGNKIAQAFYSQGKKDGNWLIWDAKGLKRFEMFYILGEKTGKWTMWDENGNITSEKTYSPL